MAVYVTLSLNEIDIVDNGCWYWRWWRFCRWAALQAADESDAIYRCGRCCSAQSRDPEPCRNHSVPDSRCPCAPPCSVQYWSATGGFFRTTGTWPPSASDLRPPTHAHRLAHNHPSACHLSCRQPDSRCQLSSQPDYIDHDPNMLQITTEWPKTIYYFSTNCEQSCNGLSNLI